MNTLVINQGSKDGIEKNMAVLTSEGLVGRISKVNQFSSQVDLIFLILLLCSSELLPENKFPIDPVTN